MTISADLKRIYATAPMDDRYIETLELSHSEFAGGKRYLTNERDGFTGTLEDDVTEVLFEPVPFAAIPPRSEEEGALILQVAIDNASRALMTELEQLATAPNEPIIVTYRVYLDSDRDVVQNDPPLVLDIQSVTASTQLISFNAGLANLRAKPFPSMLYTPEKFPGLAR